MTDERDETIARLLATLEMIVAMKPAVVLNGEAHVGDASALDWNVRLIAREAIKDAASRGLSLTSNRSTRSS